MSFSDEEVQRAAALKHWLETRIAELESELEKLREALVVTDTVLRKTSFKPAAELKVGPLPPPREIMVTAEQIVPKAAQYEETRPLKKTKDGLLLATAYVSPTQVAIVPASSLKLSTATPPFKSFFVNRILEGMKAKDLEGVSATKIAPSEVIDYQVDEEAGQIGKIAIKNYRDKPRLNEILNTLTWAFTRMLEKKSGVSE